MKYIYLSLFVLLIWVPPLKQKDTTILLIKHIRFLKFWRYYVKIVFGAAARQQVDGLNQSVIENSKEGMEQLDRQ